MDLSRRTAKAILCFVLAAFLVLAAEMPLGSLHASGRQPVEVVFVQAPVILQSALSVRFPKGSHLSRAGTSRSILNLTPDFFAAADPQVSFDATKVLFSGQKTAGDRWQIWEMNADGSGKQQLTRCGGDCLRPAYLPQDQIIYSTANKIGGDETLQLAVQKREDGIAHPITFGPGNFQVETVLRDGRILISADSPLAPANKSRPSRALYTIRPDGTGLARFREGDRTNVVETAAQELADGTILFVEKRTDSAGKKTGGELAWVRPGALRPSLITSPPNDYGTARELDGGILVVAKRDSSPSATNGKFDLFTFNLATRTLGEKIQGNPNLSSYQAVPLEPRPVPRIYWSILHPQQETGRVICLDSYLSAESPSGRLTSRISQVRIITLQPDQGEQILGTAPVESDGSFYVVVPADKPIRFELLDPTGRVIRAQRSWVWSRPGEDAGCLGCHESKAVAPSNHWPLALKRTDTPIPVGIPLRTQTAHQ